MAITEDAQSIVSSLEAAIRTTNAWLAGLDKEPPVPDDVTGREREHQVVNVPPRVEIVDARAVLADLRAEIAAYVRIQQAVAAAVQKWVSAGYEDAFVLLDRHSRSALSGGAALAFDSGQGAHDALVARADAAASSGVTPDLIAHYRALFDAAWLQRPATVIADDTALTAAIATAQETIAFLAWAKANPS